MATPDKHRFPSVHRGIVNAALLLLELEKQPSVRRYAAGDREILIEEAAAPDRIGDRQQGRGLHYFCAAHPDSRPHSIHPITCGFPNGKGDPGPSLLTMLESEYSNALMLYRANSIPAAMDSLTRALHMLADLCCPPHTCGLTYFTRYGMMHKRYEARAASLFWKPVDGNSHEQTVAMRWALQAVGHVPYQAYHDLLLSSHPPSDAESPRQMWREPWVAGTFAKLCCDIARSGVKELPAVLGSDEAARDASIRRRICLAIAHSAALLAAFDRDVEDLSLKLPEESRRYYLCSVSTGKPILSSPLTLRFDNNGSAVFLSDHHTYLSIAQGGKLQLTGQPADSIVHFRFGREPMLVLYPDGNLNRIVAQIHGQSYSIQRLNRLAEAMFFSQTAMTLLPADWNTAHDKTIS